MYENYFGMRERPFSIAPDPQYLYMSQRHQEAMAHLTYGLSQGGCFIVLTGEVGTGKTTLCRNLLDDLPDNVDVALILNANISEDELLQTICDELQINYSQSQTHKQLLDTINQHLLNNFADNRHTVLIIDEAQLLSRDVLEKIRLLTNLETNKNKLLQIILIGQPELNDVLMRNDLRQLAQRVTARYHLGALRREDIEEYVNFRLSVAGCKQPLFTRQALNAMYKLTSGIPRKINVLADHSLLASYADSNTLVDAKTVKGAASSVFIESQEKPTLLANNGQRFVLLVVMLTLMNVAFWWWYTSQHGTPVTTQESSSLSAASENHPSDTANKITKLSSKKSNSVVEMANTSSDAFEFSEQIQPSSVTGTPTIIQRDDREPGTVVVSEVFLDAENEPIFEQNDLINSSPEDRVLEQLLDTSADLTGRTLAFKQLAKLWQVSLDGPIINPICQELAELKLHCLSLNQWQLLRNYNRPAILLLEHQGQLHRVVIIDIQQNKSQIMIGGQQYEVATQALQNKWAKQAVVLWRKPNFGSPLLELGDTNLAVSKVRPILNQALRRANLPTLNQLESQKFDLDLSQKVFILQSYFKISQDSKIGYETYLLINELINPQTTPLLSNRIP